LSSKATHQRTDTHDRETTPTARRQTQQAARQRTIRRRVAAGAAGAVVLAGLVTLGALTGKNPAPGSRSPAVAADPLAGVAASGRAAQPPWPNAADPQAATKAAGLTATTSEGAAEHYHAHLDLVVNGAVVPVPAEIGVDDRAGLISPLHTHDTTGLVHIESPTAGTPYYLGQLFREWDVALSQHQLGGLHADAAHPLRVYVNGAPTAGNPADIRLAAHQEIALVYGDPGAVRVPAGYDFSGT
jgi:hypothetical protein